MSGNHALQSENGSTKQEQANQLIQAGMLAHRQGRFSDAARAYEKALKKDPHHLTALNLLADAQLNLGKNTRALNTIGRALSLNPEMPSAWLVKGSAQRRMGEFAGAITSLEKSLELKPDSTDALMTLAGTLKEAGNLDAAIDTYEDLLSKAPELSKAHYNLGNALVDDGQFDEAIFSYEEAIRLDPEYSPAQINLASALHAEDRLEEALTASEKALQMEATSRNAKLNHANILKSLIRLDEAESFYREIVDAAPKDAEAHDLLGTVLQGQARFKDAISAYRTAIDLSPKVALFKGDLATALLADGQLAEGWKNYEARIGTADHQVYQRKIGKATWQGDSLAGKTLLVWREQGIGDDIRFASCYPDLAARAQAEGGKLIIETEPRLITLYARSFPTATIRSAGEPLPDDTIHFDIPAGSLPGLLRNSISDFPAENAFLKPKESRIEKLRAEIEALGAGLKVGISWRSRNMESSRSRFYTDLSDWKALFNRPDIQLINLQYGNVDKEIEAANTMNANIHVVDGLDLMNDLDGAAALSRAVDVVISAGTSVGDMAGAVGATTYIYGAHRHPMCLGTQKFPWYPSVTWIGHQWNEPLTKSVDKIVGLIEHEVGQRG